MQTLKFKMLVPEARMPVRAKSGDAGLDLVATSANPVDSGNEEGEMYSFIEYGTGLAVEIPEGYVGLLFPRSSVSKTCMLLANAVGVVDAGYRGEIKLRFKLDGLGALLVTTHSTETDPKPAVYKVGDKIGQLVIMPVMLPTPELAEELSTSERGEGGFGSTGQ
jgi:dUTP pyrophosphatase